MTNGECNKIIAEYMGWTKDRDFWTHPDVEGCRFESQVFQYTKSLDELVPVWGELDIRMYFSYDCNVFKLYKTKHRDHWKAIAPTIQQAAAHATALAIRELK